MEEKYQRASMNALRDGMRMVGKVFEEFMDLPTDDGPTGFNDAGFWEPSKWETAVCCMPGMDCWTGAFANAAGRGQLEARIKQLGEELVVAEAEYQVLNVENERKAA